MNVPPSSADRWLPLLTPWPQGRVLFRRRTTSTMDDARRLAEEGAPAGTTVVAAFQERGRGRFADRAWRSGAGKNLLFTLLLREPLGVPRLRLPLLAGLAVARTLEARFGLKPLLKWPNDVLIDVADDIATRRASPRSAGIPGGAWSGAADGAGQSGSRIGERQPWSALAGGEGAPRKICGVLCESFRDCLLVGVGLNCNQVRFPEGIAGRAASLKGILGRAVEPLSLLAPILEALAAAMADSRWKEGIEERLYGRGGRVRLAAGGEGAEGPAGPRVLAGRLLGLADDGALLLLPEGGSGAVALYSGELSVVPGGSPGEPPEPSGSSRAPSNPR